MGTRSVANGTRTHAESPDPRFFRRIRFCPFRVGTRSVANGTRTHAESFRVSSPRNADPPNSPPRRCADVLSVCALAFVCSVFIFQVVHIPGCSVLTSEGGKAGIGLNRNLFVKKFPPQGGGGSHRLNGSALARIERVVPVT